MLYWCWRSCLSAAKRGLLAQSILGAVALKEKLKSYAGCSNGPGDNYCAHGLVGCVSVGDVDAGFDDVAICKADCVVGDPGWNLKISGSQKFTQVRLLTFTQRTLMRYLDGLMSLLSLSVSTISSLYCALERGRTYILRSCLHPQISMLRVMALSWFGQGKVRGLNVLEVDANGGIFIL